MKAAFTVVLCLLTLLIAIPAVADSTAFEQANKLYEEGHYLDAVEAYKALLTNSPTAAVHFNLGNAWFKSGQIGEAIAEYLQAEAIAPRDADVIANLKFARARVAGPSYSPGWLVQKVETLSADEWILATSLAIWGFFGLLVVRQVRPAWRTLLRSWIVTIGLLAAMLGGITLWAAKSRAATQIAVVVQRETVMRRGPFEESQSALNLKNGAELRVLDHKDGWLQVTPDGRQSGWITNGSARIVE